jgi:guanine deaminase
MCLGVIMWARIDKLYYTTNRKDASKTGFDDELFYTEISLSVGNRLLKPTQLLQQEVIKEFIKWIEGIDKIPY